MNAPSVAELIQTLPTASAVLDHDLRYVVVNDNFRRAYGLADRPLVGVAHYDVFPEISESWREAHRRCLEGASERRRADPFKRADGRVELIDWVLAPWRDADGSVAGIVLHTEVVTERYAMRRRVEEQREFIRAFFDRSPIGLNLCRLDGLWLESNSAFLDIIGYSAEEADGGLTYWELTPREYDEDEQEQLKSLETTKRYGPYEKEFIRKDGTRVPVRLNGFIIERDGEQYIWSLIEDITDQRKLEADLVREREKALQAAKLASIGELAAGVAHEINNPLQIIIACAYELQHVLQSAGVDGEQPIGEIRDAADRAARIVQGLRRFAREESSEIETHDPQRLIDEALGLTRARIRNHGVDLEVVVTTARRVRCTTLGLTQVLVNVLNNAFDAVRRIPGEIRVLAQDEGEDVVISVEDTGGGVSDAILDRLFEPFATTKPAGEGVGLGLSISRGLVESFGGTLEYAAGAQGARFTIRLPGITT